VLAIERKRALCSRPALLLVLVRLAGHCGGGALPPDVRPKLFASLSWCLRDMDFVGWLWQGRVAAAALPQDVDHLSTLVLPAVRERITRGLAVQLPRDLERCLRVRVLELKGTRKS
jgi:hypothetical protein